METESHVLPVPSQIAADSPSVSVGAEAVANTIAIYDINAEWVRFADAKAGAVLTVNGIFASFLIPTLDELLTANRLGSGPLRYATFAVFGLWIVVAVLSSLMAFLCVVPFRPRGRHPSSGKAPHFHSAATASTFPQGDGDRFVRSFEALSAAALQREVLLALHIDAHIVEVKYRRVRRAIQLLALVTVAGFTYLLVLQLFNASVAS